jgi:hypothetical protein
MRWPRFPPSRGDVIAILLGIVVAAIFMIGVIKFLSWLGWNWASNRGFGPDWVCAPTPGSEQVCFKKSPTNTAK